MYLKDIQLTEFRNFKALKVDLRQKINFFVGENGQGKTNLLESVYLLCRGQSFRPADKNGLVRFPSSEASVKPVAASIGATFVKPDTQPLTTLEFFANLRIADGKKRAMINGKAVSSAALMTQFPVILFSPESLSAIKEGPDLRRQLVDEMMISHAPRQAQLLKDYAKALKTRNRLLRNIADNIGDRQSQIDSLEGLNKIFLLLGAHLSIARIKALKEILPDAKTAIGSILGSSDVDISLEYVISGQTANAFSEAQIFDTLLNRSRELANQELSAGTSLVGPHKHDIKVLFAGKDSRFYCSQGQQRALILALKIAQIVYHHRVQQTYPILLLDDVMSELDAKKRVNLMSFLESISAQILITATDLTWPEQFAQGAGSIFAVKRGSIEAL